MTSRVPLPWCRELSRARLWHSWLESSVSAPGWDFQEENVEKLGRRAGREHSYREAAPLWGCWMMPRTAAGSCLDPWICEVPRDWGKLPHVVRAQNPVGWFRCRGWRQAEGTWGMLERGGRCAYTLGEQAAVVQRGVRGANQPPEVLGGRVREPETWLCPGTVTGEGLGPCWSLSPASRKQDAAALQLHGRRAREERQDEGAGHFLSRCRR